MLRTGYQELGDCWSFHILAGCCAFSLLTFG